MAPFLEARHTDPWLMAYEKTHFRQPWTYLSCLDLAISKIPSSFEKLTFLAGLRDESTERYTDPLAALLYGEGLNVVLGRRHRELFSAWLGLDLATQTTEVAQYLAVNNEEQNTLIEQWIQERLYEKLIPAAAREVERNSL